MLAKEIESIIKDEMDYMDSIKGIEGKIDISKWRSKRKIGSTNTNVGGDIWKKVVKLELKFLKLIKLGKQELLHTLGYQQEKMSIEAQIDNPIFLDGW